MTRKNTNISEIRIEEVHDHEQSKQFFRVYFYYESGKIEIMGESNTFFRVYFYYESGKIEIMGESNTKPILARYVSKVY